MNTKILNLKRHVKWFEMILNNKRNEEHLPLEFFNKQELKKYTHIEYSIGYPRGDNRTLKVKILSLKKGFGKEEFGAIKGKKYFILKIEI